MQATLLQTTVNQLLLNYGDQVADDIVNHQTGWEPQEEHREDDRHKGHDLLLHRVGHGGRRHLLDEEHRRAHDDRQDVVRVLRRQVVDPQNEWRMTQFN